MSSNPTAPDGSLGSTVTGPSWSMAFDVLADEHRRSALVYLHREGSVHRDELLDHVADEVDGSGADRERLALGFHHNHLPKLAEAGLVEFDRDADVVSATAAADQLLERLDLLDDG